MLVTKSILQEVVPFFRIVFFPFNLLVEPGLPGNIGIYNLGTT